MKPPETCVTSAGHQNFILITDANYKNGTTKNSTTTLPDEIALLEKDDITVSVVTWPYIYSTYEPLVTKTSGIIANIDENFDITIEPLIMKMHNSINDGVWVRLANLQFVKIDKDPNFGDKTIDSDGDGLPDISELTKKVTRTFSFEKMQSFTVECWEFKSSPAKADSDGDGLFDNEDPDKVNFNMWFDYDRTAAIDYAEKWHDKSNKDYYYYSGDCTNFVSQCMFAGGFQMDSDNDKENSWFSHKGRKLYSFERPISYEILQYIGSLWKTRNDNDVDATYRDDYEWSVSKPWSWLYSFTAYYESKSYVIAEKIVIQNNQKDNLGQIASEYGIQKGDIMIFGTSEEEYDHLTIINDIKDNDIIYASHTNPRYDDSVKREYLNKNPENFIIATCKNISNIRNEKTSRHNQKGR